MTEAMDSLLCLGDCKTIVTKYLRDEDASVIDCKVKPLESLDGLIGEQYKANIKYSYKKKPGELQAFFKILNGKSSLMFEISKEIKAYEKEDFFYNILVPKFKTFDIDVSFIPKSYFCRPYIVVLEDLSHENYRCTNKKKPLDIEHCRKAIEILALFHSTCIIYEKCRSQKMGKQYSLLDEFSDLLNDVLFSKQDTAATRWLKCSIEGLFKLVDLIPQNSITTDKFKSVLSEALNKIVHTKYDSNIACSILHGDLWSSNFLFKYECDRIIDVKLIDFQTIKYGPIALDVEQFIMTNTRRAFRIANERILLDHYYKTFSDNIRKFGFSDKDVMSQDEFISCCKAMKLPAKIQATVDRSITFMSDETYGKLIGNEEEFKKFMFSERGKYIVDCYNADEEFRELMLEDVLELKDLLFNDS